MSAKIQTAVNLKIFKKNYKKNVFTKFEYKK